MQNMQHCVFQFFIIISENVGKIIESQVKLGPNFGGLYKNKQFRKIHKSRLKSQATSFWN